MQPRSLVAVAFALGVTALSGAALAHPVTVDGSAAEWSARVPTADNLGLVARTASSTGEYVWLDNAADARTDLAAPENDANITRVQYTGTPAGLAILVRLAATTPSGAPVQVQVAIDTDRTAGSGQNFLAGFSDTQVAPEARWERLVQTRFGSGGTAVVLDPAFATTATVAAVRGADGVEVFVPWSALGLSAPPAAPLRFTVATFRAQANDDTVAVGGSEVSNALDVVTDYGDPRAASHPNTFAEVGDQVINYYADVYFGADGEVYAPLMVTRFVSDAAASTAGGNEWVALRNMTPGPLALGSFRVGDEETVDGTEGMYSFPAATLAPGATFIVAASGSQYAARYGRAADAEFATTAGDGTPDMIRYTLWTPSGSWGLANGGDEILVLDGSNTIVDVVNYGSGVYPGVTAAAVISTTARVYSRLPALPDRDDNALDFADAGATCAVDMDCPSACSRCDVNACGPRPAGTSCADADACNGAETCNAAGVCTAGTPLVCADASPCTTDSCNPATGCVNAPVAAGTPCADADACNGAETCNAVGACTAGTPLVCADANPCTVNTCNPASGCAVAFLDDGTVCGNTNVCTGRQVCGSGLCVTAAPLTCVDTNPCTTDACNPASGCDFPPVAAGTSCADADACNGAEACNAAGACAAGTPLVCADTNPCTADSCSPTTGCVNAPVAAGTSCGDGDACNGAETCNAAGACAAGTPLSCADTNPCTADSCNATTGCVNAPVAAGTACGDGDACNGAETCNAAGACAAGTPLVCADTNPCTADSCSPTTGCVNAPVAAGTACGDGDACNGAETCNAAGVCTAGTAVTCPPSALPCRINACDPTSGACVLANAMTGALCDDGDLCNGVERCDTLGACVMGPLPDGGLCGDAGDAGDAVVADVTGDAVDADDAATDDVESDAMVADAAMDDVESDATTDDATTDDATLADATLADGAVDDVDSDAAVTDVGALDVADARADARADVAVVDTGLQDGGISADIPDAATDAPPADPAGCGCRAAGGASDGRLALAGLAALGVALSRRRRRRR
ncbi:MAG: lamin tail domain-containing protein [Deltaproteobacteria bacterium]|nr:lamin tail domain-containing protein [Myxococcales bacterium]MDP3213591.1 lamin tail domain-containing protein [Deltaproteobacteria bacterium]